MPDHTPGAKAVEDIWKNTVSQIPSDYGKLAYLASLRDSDTGEYHHYGLEEVFSPEECDAALRHSHRSVFYRWLSLSLSEQCWDLLAYFEQDRDAMASALQHWVKVEPLYFAFRKTRRLVIGSCL